MITRRDTTKLLLGSAAAAVLPGATEAASREEWIRALQIALNQSVKGPNTRLAPTMFGLGRKGGKSAMSAVIRMDWVPGYRTRFFEVTGDTEKAAFRALVQATLAEFRPVNPEIR